MVRRHDHFVASPDARGVEGMMSRRSHWLHQLRACTGKPGEGALELHENRFGGLNAPGP